MLLQELRTITFNLFQRYRFYSLLWIGSAIAYAAFLHINSTLLLPSGSDFLTAFPNLQISQSLGIYESLYRNSTAYDWMGDTYWQYGPMHNLIALPLHFFPNIESVMTFLFFILVPLYISSVRILIQTYSNSPKSFLSLSIIYFVCLVNYPFLSALQQRNFELVELFLIALAAKLWKDEKLFFSGVVIGIATGIKILPGILLVIFVMFKKWQAIIGFCCSLVPQILLVQFYFGWENSFMIRLASDGEAFTIPLRQGLLDFVTRILGSTLDENILVLNRFITLVGLLLICYWLFVRSKLPKPSVYPLDLWPIVLSFAILLAPHANSYYFCLLIPLIVQALLRPRGQSNIKIYLGLLLLSIPLPFAIFWRIGVGLSSISSTNVHVSESRFEYLNTLLNFSPVFFGSLILCLSVLQSMGHYNFKSISGKS